MQQVILGERQGKSPEVGKRGQQAQRNMQSRTGYKSCQLDLEPVILPSGEFSPRFVPGDILWGEGESSGEYSAYRIDVVSLMDPSRPDSNQPLP